MEKTHKISVVAALAVLFAFGLAGPATVFAATAPALGVASGYSVFGNAGITETLAQLSHLWGNAGGNGFGNANLIASQVDGTIDAGANVPVVGAISTAYGDLAGQAQTGAIDLATSPTVTPGVYDVAATSFNSTLTLNGTGVYIFRSTSSIAQTAGGTMLLTNGATACNVFWQIPTSMTFAAAGNIKGTIITNTGLISFVSGVNLQGRAWAHTQVTMANNQITEPTCAAAVVDSTTTGGGGGKVPPNPARLTVIKHVINDNRGTAVASDFSIGVKIYGNNVAGSPASGQESGRIYQLVNTGTTTVSEIPVAGYTTSFSGDCNSKGEVFLDFDDNKFCIVTNDDIGAPVVPPVPPLIDLVKVPSPLSLPNGPGPVTYTYTLRNIGVVPVTNVTIAGDTCSPINLVSGDINGDSKLDLNETWTYRCSTTLSKTHTNNVVAAGWANGISATDIANATVVVGLPIVPPLIHVTKIPSPLTLSTGGGMITYTNKVTNPGIVALSNIRLTDDKCGPVKYVSGDTNGDSKLDTSETWTYTCRVNLTKTTTNTVIANGDANGLTARDFAIATVVVAVPKLPNTGIAPDEKNILWNIAIYAGILALMSLVLVLKKNRI